MISLSKILKTTNENNSQRVINIKQVVSESQNTKSNHENAVEDAQLYLARAHEEAEQIRERIEIERNAFHEELQKEKEHWQQEKERERKQAHDSGYEEGFQKGESEGLASYQEKLEQVQRMSKLAEVDYQQYLEQGKQDILDLSIKLANKIIGLSLEDEPERWMTLVHKAVDEVRDHDSVKIVVSSDWYEKTLGHKEELANVVHNKRLLVVPDQKLKGHACFIETPFGRIDASVDSQLKMIKTKLLEVMEADVNGDQSTS